MKPKKPNRRLWPVFLVIYLVLLVISHLIRYVQHEERQPDPGQKIVMVPESGEGASDGKAVQLAYYDLPSPENPNAPVVMVLHGSPVGTEMYPQFLAELRKSCRVIAPDYPGYGNSTRSVPDYSAIAFSVYMLSLMDELQLQKVHVVAYSLGGAVGLRMAEFAPERVASLSMLSAIGVQEMELLGNYHLNHAVHGLQLAAIRALYELVPHVGILDDFILNTPYARSFYDTDQRPLRSVLENIEMPVAVLHGDADGLVPPETAREHYRIVPHSELKMYPSGHGMVMTDAAGIAADVMDFVQRANNGDAKVRDDADEVRLAEAARPFEEIAVRKAEGLGLMVILLLLALATLVSEDLACIGGGLLAARGIIGFWPAAIACFWGIFIGDLLLYLAGRWLGKPALQYPSLKWFIKEDDVVRSHRWFKAKGPQIIIASRFLPGTRLPTYFAAGMFEAGFWMFSLYFFTACAIWTPLLVGLAMLLGTQLSDYFILYQDYAIWMIVGIFFLFWMIRKLIIPMFSFKGRRLLLSAWRRKTRWEFWPPYVFYVPLFFYILYLAIRHRSLTVFTAANPAIPDGGFVGESKSEILEKLNDSAEFVAKYKIIDHNQPLELQFETVASFMKTLGDDFPIVLKPDIGERGNGVSISHSEADIRNYLAQAKGCSIVQEYVPGVEYGVFYIRYPGEAKGRIFSITDKQLLSLTGNGKDTLEDLILKNDRTVCMAPFHLKKHQEQLYDVPAAGEKISLVELGTHCKGALFLNGMSIQTPQLEEKIDDISRRFQGFYFGRYDIRTPSLADFQQGKNFKIVELNGVTSEATHIYDPQNNLFYAYRTLMKQWKSAFEIGALNVQNGVPVTPFFRLIKLIF